MPALTRSARSERTTGAEVRARRHGPGPPPTLSVLAALPLPSLGVLSAPLADHRVAYDLVTEMVHVLNPTAALVWELCDGETSQDRLIAEIADITGAPADVVATDVHAYVATLTEAGLVRRDAPPPAAATNELTPVSGTHTSPVFGVVDDGVVLVSNDSEILQQASTLLASLAGTRPISIRLGLEAGDDGGVTLSGWGPPHSFPTVDALLDALPTALNQIAAFTSTCITLHAGCVRSPSGEVVVLPATSGSGKTTLTAALVRLGWDYATDEAVGVRSGSLMAVAYPKPLVLDAVSREVLRLAPSESVNVVPTELRADVMIAAGDVGPVDRVILPRYQAGARLQFELLDPRAAVVAVLEHALNLRHVGQVGLDAVCELAQRIPVLRLVHGDINEAVAAVTDSSSA